MKVKVCGITCLGDGLEALKAGADLLGFNFFPRSPRYISPVACTTLLRELRQEKAGFKAVGIFVNEPAGVILEIMHECVLDMAQLSGDEPPSLLEALSGLAFKAIRPASPEAALDQAARYARQGGLPALLVDAAQAGMYGGSGKIGNWAAGGAVAEVYPILLAGGLSPSNVAEAVAAVKPWGVDVASGVESSPGRKDPEKLIRFIKAAHNLENVE